MMRPKSSHVNKVPADLAAPRMTLFRGGVSTAIKRIYDDDLRVAAAARFSILDSRFSATFPSQPAPVWPTSSNPELTDACRVPRYFRRKFAERSPDRFDINATRDCINAEDHVPKIYELIVGARHIDTRLIREGRWPVGSGGKEITRG